MSYSMEKYKINHPDQLDSPALVIFPAIVRQNIAQAIRIVGDVKRLRPHIKTNKSVEATKLLMEAGITKFKCATIAEAEMLGMCGAKDVLLAYQPVGPKLGRFLAVMRKYPATQYSCLIDDTAAAKAIATASADTVFYVPVYIDLNVGQNRTGISPEAAYKLYTTCSKLPGIRPVGLHAYDGHIRNTDWEARKKACDEAFQAVTLLRDKLVATGYREPAIIAGGSPTFPIHALRADVECSPGTFIYWDKGYSDLCPEQPFLPAALLMSRVVSLPDAAKICLDLGHKSVAAENVISQRISFPEAPYLLPIGQSEEHLVLEAGTGHTFKPGDVLFGIPYHICPTVALFESTPVIENGEIAGIWRTIARDRTITC